MIFVAAGTKDGRDLADFLQARGFAVTASVVSEYGGELLRQNAALTVNDKPLDFDELVALLRQIDAKAFVDATHPYARNISQNAIAACQKLNLPYVRYERPVIDADYDKIYLVADYEHAADKAAELGQNIFLTTGSRSLPIFAERLANRRIIARVLPSPEVLEQCFSLGLKPDSIIAMQGPFSPKLNEEMFRQTKADVIVTKNSGRTGGTDTKILAAKALGLPVVMIARPIIDYPAVAANFAEVAAFVNGVVANNSVTIK